MAKKAEVQVERPDLVDLGIGLADWAGAAAAGLAAFNALESFLAFTFWFAVCFALIVIGGCYLVDFGRAAWVWVGHDRQRTAKAILVVGILILVALVVLIALLIVLKNEANEFTQQVGEIGYGSLPVPPLYMLCQTDDGIKRCDLFPAWEWQYVPNP